ncbi:hypothetical protein IFU39_12130 [Paenibacillus sp. CFBP 13594]|uniref:hypothetical protein n=1 Tax=Paenibacillus sp. CFBP 13594 TaxID=2774037 RepID=UPI001783D85B|nr:hypothetical protein [Paenibacillus sp. CFBP 13594]MBD8838563.1 hypothetical protein [Paenibacillus sp. CFBP 13594]
MQTEAWKETMSEQEAMLAMVCGRSPLERSSSHHFMEHHGLVEGKKGRQHIEGLALEDLSPMETSENPCFSLTEGSHNHMMNHSKVQRSQWSSFAHLIFGSRLLIGLVILFSAGTIYFASSVEAAGIDLGVTAQKAWDSVLNKADAQTKLTLKQAYEKVGNWKAQEQAWEQKIKTLHAANTAELERLRVEIRQTDDAKVAALAEKVKQTQARYEPLFALYSSVNRQLNAAKAIKNKEWSAAIRTQAETLKPVVKLAREDIRIKKKELAEARKRKSAEIKRLRAMLAGADSAKKQIQTAKKQATLAKERYSNALQQFKQNTKQGQTSRVLSSLNTLASAAEKWTGTKQNIHTLEQKVSTTYVKVRQEIAKRLK